MKFLIEKASDWDYKKVVDINSLEELLDLYKTMEKESEHFYNGLIVSEKFGRREDEPNFIITVYDYYVE